MNREILFRGKRIGNGVWIYGNRINIRFLDKIETVIQSQDVIHEFWPISSVYQDSIGQYTGFKDKNGTMIFEGDILNVSTLKHSRGFTKENIKCVVVFESGMFYPKPIDESYKWGLLFDKCEVIGNIFDNPELLNEPDIKP